MHSYFNIIKIKINHEIILIFMNLTFFYVFLSINIFYINTLDYFKYLFVDFKENCCFYNKRIRVFLSKYGQKMIDFQN